MDTLDICGHLDHSRLLELGHGTTANAILPMYLKALAMLLVKIMRSGRACMLLLGLHPPKGPNCASIIAGLRALVQC